MNDLLITKHGILLEKTDAQFEEEGVLNPGTTEGLEGYHLLYRAVAKGNRSSIGYCKLSDPLNIGHREKEPVMVPEMAYEEQGMEDPRMVKIEDVFYITYTGFDGVNALGALATTTDLKTFERKGIIVPEINYIEFNALTVSMPGVNEKYKRYNDSGNMVEKLGKRLLIWDKNVILFPRKINDRFYFLHRIKPDIQIVAINDWTDLTEEFWHNYFLTLEEHIVLTPKYDHEVSYIGGGCPPIETDAGWLIIYHAVHDTIKGYVYSACAALLDLRSPQKEIARLPYVLFKPDLDWELEGVVTNVCFPTGTFVVGDILYIYYGAADEKIACASVSLSSLIKELLLNKI
jgi:beta-1,2-mannobiose phosphorylase / 1,2-beta-oligomannan phosphorylase